jgi:hypothetical protein
MMNRDKLYTGMSVNESGLSRRALSGLAQWLLGCVLIVWVCSSFTSVIAAQELPTAKVEIHYNNPEAGEVFLVWGVDGWTVPPEANRPAGTMARDDVMHTPMTLKEDTFAVLLEVQPGATIDFGFLVTQKRDGTAVHIWEANGAQDFHITATQDGIVKVQTALVMASKELLGTQEIRYLMPEAGEVFLVWGVDGWAVIPEGDRPAGTVVKDGVMHTPMSREGNLFLARIKIPLGKAIDYGFLITKKRQGNAIAAVWDGNESYRLTAGEVDSVEVRARATLEQAKELPTLLDVFVYLLAGIGILAGIGAIVMRIPPRNNRRFITLALICLTLVGLTLRLRVVGTTQRLLTMPAQLIGDEPRYEEATRALLQGDFFPLPITTPVYPLFLAACYTVFGHSYAAVLLVQALIGTAAIPLTYRLAHRFTSKRSSLLAAAIVALCPCLISYVGYLYTEVLYTLLLLLTLLSLLWALEAPLLRRFVLAGATLGISTICRSATALFPMLIPFMLPRTWCLRRRVVLWATLIATMAALIAPWTYHNYRTHRAFIPFSLSMTMLWHGSPEFYHVMEQKQNAMLEVWNEELNPARNGGINPITIEGDRYFNARAIASIRSEPGTYVWYSLQKLAFFWIGHPAANYDWPFDFSILRAYFPAWEIAGLFGGRLLMLMMTLTGLVILRSRLREFVPLLAICGYLMVFYAILVPVARYSEPLYPILAVIIAAAADEIIGHHHTSQIVLGA